MVRSRILLGLLTCVFLALFIVTTDAQTTNFAREDLDKLEAQYIQAQMRLADLEAQSNATPLAPREVEERLIRLGKDIAKHNARATELEDELLIRKQKYDEALVAYGGHKALHNSTLLSMVLESRSPPPPPLYGIDDVRSGIRRMAIYDAIQPKIKDRMIATQTEINILAALQTDIAQARKIVLTNKRVLDTERSELEALISLKRAHFKKRRIEIDNVRTEVDSLAIRAKTLRKLIDQIEARAPPPPSLRTTAMVPPRRTSPQNFKSLTSPVAGPVVIKFGEKDSTGLPARGIYIQARPGDIVLAPVGGVIVFAENYRDFGKMVILRVSENHHIVMHGMENLFAEFGETLQTAQPIGKMPSASDGRSGLFYLETRNQNGPTNPTKWLKG